MASAAPNLNQAVDEAAFVQCVHALRRTLATTPLGWLLILWVCHGRVPDRGQWVWLVAFVGSWLFNVLLLARMARVGPTPAHDGRQLLWVAALDGAAWGLIAPLLMSGDAILNAWLAAILCGVVAVNAPVYITWFRAFQTQVGALWALVAVATLLEPDRPQAFVGLVGLSVFAVLISVYMHRISARVVEGIRLQIANAELAEQLRVALAHSQHQATTDALTGLSNRRALDDMLAAMAGAPLGLLMLDLDHFKTINDTHGHAVGDAVLRNFSARVREQLRPTDVCVRWGGEEFVVLLPGASLAQAQEIGERLRQAVVAAPLDGGIKATVSIGAAARRAGEDTDALLARADAAVYAAKHAGRDRVVATQ